MKKILFVAAVLAWTSCSPSGPAEFAPPLSVPFGKDTNLELADYKGKVVLVDFWATWCAPCKAEIPELIKLQTKFGAKGFLVFGVSMDEEVAEVLPFTKKAGVNYPIVFNGGETAPKGWVVPGLPTAYLIGRDGRILRRIFGSKSFEKLNVDIEAALAAK